MRSNGLVRTRGGPVFTEAVRTSRTRYEPVVSRFGNVIVDAFASRVSTAIEFLAEVSIERNADEPNRLPAGWQSDAYLLEPTALTTADAHELIAAPRAAPLLTGYAGAPPADLPALAELALRLSTLGDALPELAECTLRALAAPHGAHVTSALVRIAPSTARGDAGPRRLRGL